MSNRLLFGPRFSIGNKAPVWPYALNRISPQAKGLVAWWPGDPSRSPNLFDLGGYNIHAVIQDTAELLWVPGPFGGWVVDFSGDPANANAMAESAHHPVLDITGDITLSCWMALDTFTGTGRGLIAKTNGTTQWDYDFFVFTASRQLRFYSDATGNLAAANTALATGVVYHVGIARRGSNWTYYLNGAPDGTVTNGAALGSRSIGITLGSEGSGVPTTNYNGRIWDIRIYNVGKTAVEMAAMFEPETRFELFEELPVPRIWPEAASGTAGSSVNASLQAALRQQASLSASVEAALRAELTLAATADAALARAFSGVPGLDAAAQAIRIAQADLDTALRGALERGAGLDASLAGLGPSQRSAALDSAVRKLNSRVVALQAALGTDAKGAALFDAMLAFEVQGFAGLDAVAQLGARLGESVLEAAVRVTGSRAAALDAIVGLVAAAAAGRTFDVTANRSHGVAAPGRRAAIPSD